MLTRSRIWLALPSLLGRGVLVLTILSVPPSTSAAFAQRKTASITGIITNRENSVPIPDATVKLLGGSTITSDSAGSFGFSKLRGGTHVIEVRAIGYEKAMRLVDVADGGLAKTAIEMEVAVAQLIGVVVEAKKSRGRRFQEFERRREQGHGFFFTREEIEERNATSLTDILRTVRGVRLDCTGTQCRVHMARSQRGCQPQYYVDSVLSNEFGPSTPVRDIEGIEVYLGPSETPAEFLGINAGCGVIAIWTRSSP
jgi:hypothetical protein